MNPTETQRVVAQQPPNPHNFMRCVGGMLTKTWNVYITASQLALKSALLMNCLNTDPDN